jgi:V/A-type H+-transporting ATPase subunit C
VAADTQIRLSGDTAYTYTVGRVRVLENRLLSQRALHDAVAAADYSAAVDALREGGYESEPGGTGLRRMLEEHQNRLRAFLYESLPRGPLRDYLLSAVDYANLKAALIARLIEKEPTLHDGGLAPVEALDALAAGGDADELPEPLDAVARAALETWEDEGDPYLLQQHVDRAAFSRRLELAAEIDLPFLDRYLELEIDLINLASLARCLNAAEPAELADTAFIDGGSLEYERLRRLARSGERDEALDYVRGTPYAEIAADAVSGGPAGLRRLRLGGSRRKLDFLRRARLASFGAEPVLAYYYFKRNELELVRFILTCKLNEIPPDEINANLGFSG